MKRNLLFILVALLPVVASADVSDTNPTESLYGEWWLVGWNDEGTWFEVDTNFVSHHNLSIEIPIEGYVMAYSLVNEIFVGNLTLNGNEMIFTEGGGSTAVYADVNENLFFEEHICDIKSYLLEGNQLRLYYTDEDYFVFTNDFDGSEERYYEWKNGPADPYISEVTAMNDEEVEVKIVQCPSYVTFYSRTTPPHDSSDICRFATTDLANQTFEVGDKVAFQITMFKRQKVEKGREYQLKVEPSEGTEHITNRTGKMHNDRRMGWIIIDDKVNEKQGGIYYYPLRKLAEEYLTEGVPVKFSGELYPTWKTPWDNEGHSDCYYLSIDAINTSIEYFPEGTNWTEIRLDTLKYDSWYSKVDGEWVPNFETIEYRVRGEYGEASDNYWNAPYKCIYTNALEWTDSLTLLISEGEINGLPTGVLVTVYDNYDDLPLWPSSYPFEWEIGTMITFKDILSANMTALFPPDLFDFGVVEEIKEGDFGGVRPLKYSDVKGVRMIQGIGVATWNDGECIFGPLKPYMALSLPHEERHYRSMLVHFERDGEVLYNVWPEKGTEEEPVFLTENTAWVDGFGYEQDGQYKTNDVKLFYYTTAGDTLINDKTYFRIQRSKVCKTYDESKIEVQDDNLCFFMREDEAGDVWFYTEDKNVFYEISHNSLYEYIAENLVGRDLFLFNAKKKYAVGDALPLGMSVLEYPEEGQDYWQIYSLDVENVSERNLLDGNTYPIYNNYFVESIGPLDGPLSGIGSPNTYNLDIKQLFTFYRDGLLIYKNEDYLAALEEHFPDIMNIVTGASTIYVTFTQGQIATIILPVEPDASKGKYYRLDRVEDGKIVFEQELHPQAHVPYIIVPNFDFSIDLNTLDLQGCCPDTVSIKVRFEGQAESQSIYFIGSYVSEELEQQEGCYIQIIDTTPDCSFSSSGETGKGAFLVGALRAYLTWDDPIDHGGAKGRGDMEIVLRDYGTDIKTHSNSPLKGENKYDLSGRKIVNGKWHGIYIENGQKRAK